MRKHAIRAWEAFWPSLILWLPMLSVFIVTDSSIPQVEDAKLTILILVLLIEFLVVEFALMLRNYIRLGRGVVDYTALALITVSLGLAVAFLAALGLFVNRDWALANPDSARRINNVARAVGLVTLGWGFYQLLSVEQVAREEKITRLGVIVTVALVVQAIIVYIVTR